VLGSGAGGGVPQWNCGCRVCRLAWSGDPRVKPRTQAGVALSVDGANWVLLNASIDLRQQILATPALHPKGGGSAARGRTYALKLTPKGEIPVVNPMARR
jgi:pyrroloquinoline quinone biosynthesis protein B